MTGEGQGQGGFGGVFEKLTNPESGTSGENVVRNLNDVLFTDPSQEEIAAQQAGNSRMRISPEAVDSLANFFQAEGEALKARDHSQLQIPGAGIDADPVSAGAMRVHNEVAGPGEASFSPALGKVADELLATAQALRGISKTTTNTDQGEASQISA